MDQSELPVRLTDRTLAEPPRQLLLVQLSPFKSVVQTLPAISDIAARWPDAAIDWAVDSRFADVPRLHPSIRRVIPLPVAGEPLRLLSRLRVLRGPLRELREQRYDLIWDCQGVVNSAVVCRLARGALRVGYRAEDCVGAPMAARAYGIHFARPRGLHGTGVRRVFAHAAFDTDTSCLPDYAIDRRFTHTPDGSPPAAFLAHGASSPENLWPEDRWKTLAQQLVALGLRVVLTWSHDTERARARRIAQALPAGSADILDRKSVMNLLDVIAESRLVVGVDTGFTHAAAALRRPVVALFVDGDASAFAPSSPERARTLGGNGQVPSADAVLTACRELLS